MTTSSLEHDGPSKTSAAARLGAIAGVTPVAMFLAWIAISGWGGTRTEFVQALAVLMSTAVVAGWIVGARSGPSIRSGLRGVIACSVLGYLLLLTVGVIGSTWSGIGDGTLRGPFEVVASMVLLLLYGVVSAIYLIPFLTPFGVGWAVTYFLLRRRIGV